MVLELATIADVAKEAGVSVRTVSRALNDYEYVSEKTKKKIFDTMKKMNFAPNNVAQQLRGKSTRLIGVIISRVTNPFFSYLVNSIEKTVYNEGYQVVILQTKEDKEREINFLEMLTKKQLDGMILTNIENDWREIEQFYNNYKMVICNRNGRESDIPIIKIDEQAAAYEAITYLLKKGYKKIAYSTGSGNINIDQRYKGYLQALKENNIKPYKKHLFSGVIGIEEGKQLVHTINKMGDDAPDAIFTSSDEVAAGIIGESYRINMKIPDDLAVVGFDDQPIATLLHPSLTTIRQPIEAMGEYAANVLLSMLKGSSPPKPIELKTELIVREST